MMEHAGKMRAVLDKYGYTDAESIIDEWNYVESWGDGFTDSIRTIIGAKGAACTLAAMSGGTTYMSSTSLLLTNLKLLTTKNTRRMALR